TARLLRRHIVRSTELGAGRGERDLAGVAKARNAEVQDFDPALAVAALDEHEVIRFQVSVHHALVMRMSHASAGLPHQLERGVYRERPLALQGPAKRLAVEVLHHVVGGPAKAVQIEHGRQVVMLEARQKSSFTFEAEARAGLTGALGAQEFDGEAPADARALRLEHHAHSTRADLAYDAVAISDDSAQRGELEAGAFI